jgi:hypothetical protein
MEWAKIWRTVFCGWDGDVDLWMLADELRGRSGRANGGEDRDAMAWVRRQIQEAY